MSPVSPRDAAPGDHPHDELAAYAVDAVDDGARGAIEAHLATCPACRRELAAHHEVLSRMIGDESPPPAIWDRVAQETAPRASDHGPVSGDTGAHPRPPGEGTTPSGAGPPRQLRGAGSGSRSRRGVIGALAAAAAVVVAVGIVPRVWDALREGDGGPPTTEVVAPTAPSGEIRAADGTVVARVATDDRGTYVELGALAPLTADRTYQLWSLDRPDPVSLGLLGTGAEAEVRVSLPEGTTRVAISDEPAGGSPAPTGLIAGAGELAAPA